MPGRESRIAYNAFKREESRWTRQQNDLASQEESRLRGKRPKAKKARPRVDQDPRGASDVDTFTIPHHRDECKGGNSHAVEKSK